MNKGEDEQVRCAPVCWTPVPCGTCGQVMPPRGRAVALSIPTCCDTSRMDPTTNPRHLWDEHDSTRWYADPAGWDAHVASCVACRERES